MKTTAVYRQKYTIPYPNAATRREILQKVLDTLLITASGMGIAVILLFLTALS